MALRAGALSLLSRLMMANLAVDRGLPGWIALIVGIAVGARGGFLTGVLVTRLRLPPFIVTLGTMSVYRGLVFVLSGGAWVSSHLMPSAFIAFPLSQLFGVTHLVWIAIVVILLAWYLARYPRYGRDLFAFGKAPAPAACGIPDGWCSIAMFGIVRSVAARW